MASPFRHAPLVLLVVALALGGWLRFSDADATRLYGDEAEYALVAHSLTEDPFHPSYTLNRDRYVPFVSQPPLVLYTIALFGASEFAAKAVVASFGVLGILAVFLLGREAYDSWTGAVAAALLAIAPMHVQVSRLVFLDVPLATFAYLSAWLVLRWLRTRTRRDATFAACATAGAVLSKLPGVLVPAALVLALAVHALRERLHHGSWRAAADAEGTVVGAFVVPSSRRNALWGIGVLVGIGLVYILFIAVAGQLGPWIDKLGWQAARVAGDEAMLYTPASVYLEGPESLPARLGTGLWYLGLVGVLFALVSWLVPARLRRGTAPKAADAIVVGLTMFLFVFFLTADRKVWFYVLPVVPGLVLLGARAGVAAIRFAAKLLPARNAWLKAARPVAPALVLGVLWTQAAVPAVEGAFLSATPQEGVWGRGFDDACAWMESQQEGDEAAISSLLSRYSLRFYCPELDVHDRFRSQRTLSGYIAQREIRWLVPDPYYIDPADTEAFARLTASFPTVRVASFGLVHVYEFQPTNLTLRVAPSASAYGASEPVPVTIRVTNPPNAETRTFPNSTLAVTVQGYTSQGYAFDLYSENVSAPFSALSPGESREFTWTWQGQTSWSESPHRAGTFRFDVSFAGEHARSNRITRG